MMRLMIWSLMLTFKILPKGSVFLRNDLNVNDFNLILSEANC